MYKAIASDIDGTLLQNGSRVLREDIIPAIQDYIERGGVFLPASGRQQRNLRMMFAGVENDISYIAENGCLIYHEGKLIHYETMARDSGVEIARRILSIPGARLAISGVECVYVMRSDPGFFDYIENHVKTKAVYLDDPSDMPEDFFKISAYSKEGVEIFENRLKEAFSKDFNVVTSGLCWTDIMPKQVNKGSALKVFSEKTGIKLEDFVALGDHYNDLEMMEIAGHPACVSNAVDEIKALCEKEMECGADLLLYYLRG